jgi:hypothetical protein
MSCIDYLPAVNTPRSSSWNLENLSDRLGFLNIRAPGRCLSQDFPGSRILKNSNPQPALREEFLNSGMTNLRAAPNDEKLD